MKLVIIIICSNLYHSLLLYCLEAYSQEQVTPEVAQQMAKKVGYTMHCIEYLQSPYGNSPPTKVIHFRVSNFSLMKGLNMKFLNYG